MTSNSSEYIGANGQESPAVMKLERISAGVEIHTIPKAPTSTWLWCTPCGCASRRPSYVTCACCGRVEAELEIVDETTVRARLDAIRARRWGLLSPADHEARHGLADLEVGNP